MNERYIALLIGVLLLLVGVGLFITAALTEQTRTIETDCFDVNWNKINGVTCTERQYNYYGLGWNFDGIIFIFLLGTVDILAGIISIFYTLGCKAKEKK